MDAAERDAVRQQLAQADLYLQTAGTLQVPAAAMSEAEAELNAARDAMDRKDYDTATRKSARSRSVSQAVIKAYYLETVGTLAERARNRLTQALREDADRPLDIALAEMTIVADRASAVANDWHLVALDQVLDDLKQVLDITETLDWRWEKKFQTDRIFIGGDELTVHGAEMIRLFLDQVSHDLKGMTAPTDRRLRIRVTGYTDLLDFGKDTPLVRRLLQEAPAVPDASGAARRRFLNRRLSVFRGEAVAREVNAYFDRHPPGLPLHVEVIGNGEQIPPGLSPPYPVSDPRRRICKLHLIVEEVRP